MALRAVLLLSFAFTQTHTFEIQGGLMSFMPVEQHLNGTFTVSFHYKESYGGKCAHQLTWSCGSGDCGQITLSEVKDTDEGVSNVPPWCQSEGHILRYLSNDKPIMLRDTGCCWVSNLNGAANWTLVTHVDMGTRSDTHILNKSPVMTTIPTIRIPQNCFTTFPLQAHDPDGDQVRCRFGQASKGECDSCHQHPNFNLDETLCTLQMNNTPSIGVHVFEMVVEDYPTQAITLSYSDKTSSARNPLNLSMSDSDLVPLSKLPLQFAIEIHPSLKTCVPGVMRPQFLSPTPEYGSIHYAVLGQLLKLTLRAQATESIIYDFQLSGPYNMTKVLLQNNKDGTTEVHINWIPQESDIYRHVPVCFTAETRDSQSEMRCIVVVVAKEAPLSGQANISCMDNTITITLDKDSMQGVEASQLYLKDPTCSLTTNGSHIMATLSLNSCGTQMENGGDYMIFKNEINSIKETSVITRRHSVKIPFSCRYSKQGDVLTNFKNHKSDYIFTETGFGSFSYSFEFYKENTFKSMIDPSSYPVEVKLLDKIYMGIQAHSSLPQVNLFVESCKATPDDNPDNALYYDIIKNGCSMDDTLVVSPAMNTEFMFEIQAFKFSGDFEKVYISCRVILCEAGNPNSRCAQGCLSNPTRRRKRNSLVQTHEHVITQGPLILQKRGLLGSASAGGSQSSNKGILAFSGLFIIALLVVGGLVAYNIRKTKALDRSHLLSSF
ncbi:hypothetical protein AAFF_G00362160 [Aldrovandia affinis]|uniref:ZP domain-containing protein n=1 Tax=Aldrovandia affinis TaxID=143900 RepID=A0AAD7SHW3_9TELE|nr:hypothetical protein AAFF_G00362160 [Aldrovandia affinis]